MLVFGPRLISVRRVIAFLGGRGGDCNRKCVRRKGEEAVRQRPGVTNGAGGEEGKVTALFGSAVRLWPGDRDRTRTWEARLRSFRSSFFSAGFRARLRRARMPNLPTQLGCVAIAIAIQFQLSPLLVESPRRIQIEKSAIRTAGPPLTPPHELTLTNFALTNSST